MRGNHLFAFPLSLFFLVPLLLFASGAQADTCPRWEAVGSKFCDTVNTPVVSGQTDGEDYLLHSGITDAYTKQNARDLKSGDENVVIDKHSLCRYLTYEDDSSTSNPTYFVPFRTEEEWRGFLNNTPDQVLAELCAPEKTVTASTVCGDLTATRLRGKVGDRQQVLFSFLRGQNWRYLTPDGRGNCVDSGRTAKTTCGVNIAAIAQANPTAAVETATTKADWAGEWEEVSMDPAGDCTPASPSCADCMEKDGCDTNEALTIMTYALPNIPNSCNSWATQAVCPSTCLGQTGVAAGAWCRYYTGFSRFDAGSGGAWRNIRNSGATAGDIGGDRAPPDNCSGGNEDGFACWGPYAYASLAPTTYPCGASCTPKTIYPAIANTCNDNWVQVFCPSTCDGSAASPGSTCTRYVGFFRFDADSGGAWRNITRAGYVGHNIAKRRAYPGACTGDSNENGLACMPEVHTTTTTYDPALCVAH